MLTLSGEYALRAMVYLAQNAKLCPISGRAVAKQAGIPARYLSKILSDLVRAGVLESSPGRTGGFRLCRPAENITLHDVVRTFVQFDTIRCPFGNNHCDETNPCAAHTQWKNVIETERRFLVETTIRDVAAHDGAARTRTRKPAEQERRLTLSALDR